MLTLPHSGALCESPTPRVCLLAGAVRARDTWRIEHDLSTGKRYPIPLYCLAYNTSEAISSNYFAAPASRHSPCLPAQLSKCFAACNLPTKALSLIFAAPASRHSLSCRPEQLSAYSAASNAIERGHFLNFAAPTSRHSLSCRPAHRSLRPYSNGSILRRATPPSEAFALIFAAPASRHNLSRRPAQLSGCSAASDAGKRGLCLDCRGASKPPQPFLPPCATFNIFCSKRRRRARPLALMPTSRLSLSCRPAQL